MRKAKSSGFSLIELLVAVAIIGIIAAIAVPNMLTAMEKARHRSAYTSMRVLETGIHTYMIDRDAPPTSMNPITLEPLVSARAVDAKQRVAIVSSLEGNRLMGYWGWSGNWWWGYDYQIMFRPKKDRTNVVCYMYPEAIYRWDGTTWTTVE